MSTTERVLAVPPEEVWSILSDGWLYPLWVVGASRMREVDESWPAPGSHLHHSAGAWPLLVDDSTLVEECRPGELLVLEARGWPLGQATVRIGLTGVAEGTRVRLEEDASAGPARLVPSPVRQAGLHWRNTETLRRLAYLAERRSRPGRDS